MQPATKIRVLKGLPLAIAPNRRLFYDLETLAAIKTMWIDRPMPAATGALLQLAEVLNLSLKQLERPTIGRIERLLALGWLTFTQGRGYDAISWDSLAATYSIKHIHYYHLPVTGATTLRKILISKAKLEKLNQCARAYCTRVKCNTSISEVLQEVTGTQPTDFNFRETAAYHQLQNFAYPDALYTDAGAYVLSAHYQNKADKVLRADNQLNYLTWSRLFGYKSRGGYAKLKRSLVSDGLITCHHRVYTIPGHSTRESRAHTRMGYVHYNPATRELLLVQCDEITVHPLKGLEQRKAALPSGSGSNNPLHSQVNPETSDRVKRAWITRKSKQNEKTM